MDRGEDKKERAGDFQANAPARYGKKTGVTGKTDYLQPLFCSL